MGYSLEMIPIEKIRIGDLNIRAEDGFGDEEDQALVENVGSFGILQPIIVRPVGDIYELTAGRRRLLSAKENGLTEIPSIVMDVQDEEAMDISLIENIHRKDVDPVTLGWWVKRRQERSGKSLRELAREIGVTAMTLSRWRATTNLTEEMQQEIKNRAVSLDNALAVVKMDLTPDEERALAEESRSGGSDAFKKALDRVSEGKEKRGAPKGLLITRINWGFESQEYEALKQLSEAKGVDISDYCMKVLAEHIQAQTQA